MSHANDQTIARVHNLVCGYNKTGDVLNNISFHLPIGACSALLGVNGAGKSTLLLCLSGLLPISGGEIEVCGQRIAPHVKSPSLVGKVGIVFQDPDDQLFGLTVADDVAMGPRALHLSEAEVAHRRDAALNDLDIAHLSERQPHLLSLGEKRRVALAGILATSPSLVLFDEPTAFLDSAGQQAFETALEHLTERQISVLIATHDVDFVARWAKDVIILKQGRVITTGDRHLLTKEPLMSETGLRLPLTAEIFAPFIHSDEPLPVNVIESHAWLQKRLAGVHKL